MPGIKTSDELLAQALLVQQVDNARSATDFFKLSPVLRTVLDTAHQTLQNATAAVPSARGVRQDATALYSEAIATLKELLRAGFKHIDGQLPYVLTAAQKRAALEAYGWTGAKLGALDKNTRILDLAQQAIAVTPTLQPEVARYPVELVTRIQAALQDAVSSAAGAQTGDRQSAIKARNEARKELEIVLARVRFYYCAMSNAIDRTPELAKIGFQPRRVSGQRRTNDEAKAAQKAAPTEPTENP